jgi:hypothetical protein
MASRQRIFGVLGILVLMTLAFGAGWFVGRAAIGEAIDPATLPVVERAFVEQMQGAALVGYFTVSGRESQPGTPDRYDIYSVEKVGEDRWRFNARIGETGVTLPIVVRMMFADDTPVIVMTGMEIPGMGMFTARVLFHGDQYTGTWSHVGSAGGHMFGRIERGAAQSQERRQ